jgi:hypothetical protein
MACSVISADEALLWLRSHHAETVRIALEGMSALRELMDCNIGIANSGGWDKAPDTVRAFHAKFAARATAAREALEARAAATRP